MRRKSLLELPVVRVQEMLTWSLVTAMRQLETKRLAAPLLQPTHVGLAKPTQVKAQTQPGSRRPVALWTGIGW